MFKSQECSMQYATVCNFSYMLHNWWQHFKRMTTILYTQESTNEVCPCMCVCLIHTHIRLCSHSCFFFQTCPLSVFLSSALDKSDALLASTFLLQVMIHHSRPFRSYSSLIIHLIRLLISNMSQKHSYVLPQTDHKHTHTVPEIWRDHIHSVLQPWLFLIATWRLTAKLKQSHQWLT